MPGGLTPARVTLESPMEGGVSLLAFWFNDTGVRPTARLDFRQPFSTEVLMRPDDLPIARAFRYVHRAHLCRELGHIPVQISAAHHRELVAPRRAELASVVQRRSADRAPRAEGERGKQATWRNGTDGSSNPGPIVLVGLDFDSLAERVRGLRKLVEAAVSVTEIRNRGARERVSVMRAASPLSAPGST